MYFITFFFFFIEKTDNRNPLRSQSLQNCSRFNIHSEIKSHRDKSGSSYTYIITYDNYAAHFVIVFFYEHHGFSH